MSKQNNKVPVRNLAEKRRTYLGQKLACIFFALCLGTVGIAAGFAGLILLSVSFVSKQESSAGVVSLLIIALMSLVGAAYITACSVRLLEDYRKAPYIPPVAEQLAALPAEELLLRGSDQPTATSEDLLRAAQARTEQPAEELLRAGSGTV